MGRQERKGTSAGKSKRVHHYTPDAADYGIKALEHELAEQGLYIKDITGDGNCLFRSLADQLGHTNTHGQLRHDVVQYLRGAKEEFSVFVEEDYDAYLDRMSNDGVYGDNLEIVAFSRIKNKAVKIYQPGLSYIVRPQDSADDHDHDDDKGGDIEAAEMLHIVYHSYEHYSSVRNKDGPHDGPPNVRPVKTDIARPFQERPSDAPPSDMEKICLASVPGVKLAEVRKVIKSNKGNVNAAIEVLLERQSEQDVRAAMKHELAEMNDPSDPEVEFARLELQQQDESQDLSIAEQDRPLSEKESKEDATDRKASTKRPSAREKKEEAKKAQKLAARERKRKTKTRSAQDVQESASDHVKTIAI